jgi:hypothetical protein
MAVAIDAATHVSSRRVDWTPFDTMSADTAKPAIPRVISNHAFTR